MANYYVYNVSGDNSNDGLSWSTPKANISGGLMYALPGDTIYVSHRHSETHASGITLLSSGTLSPTGIVSIICVDDSAMPPTTIANTARVITSGTGPYNINFQNTTSTNGSLYVYGINFYAGSGLANSSINMGTVIGTSAPLYFNNCGLFTSGNGGSHSITMGVVSSLANRQVSWENTRVGFNHPNGGITCRNNLKWSNGSLIGVKPNFLFAAPTFPVSAILKNIDLSLTNATLFLVSSNTTTFNAKLINCELASGVSIHSTFASGDGLNQISLINCHYGDNINQYYKASVNGRIFDESIVTTTDGAPSTRRMVGHSGTHFRSPLISDPMVIYNSSTGVSLNASVEIISNSGVTFKDDEVWLTIEYPGYTDFSLYLSTGDGANLLQSGVDQSFGTAQWNSGTLTNPIAQKLDVNFTPMLTGLIYGYINLAKVDSELYYDRKLRIV